MPRPTGRLAPLGTALTAAMLLLAGCVTPPDDNPNDPGSDPDPNTDAHMSELDTLDQGSYPQGPAAAEDRVITDRETWLSFWQEHSKRTSGSEQGTTAPEVDFDTHLVLFAYAGEKRTGGYAIEIRKVVYDGATYTATVTTLEPGRDCITTDALTYPFHIVQATRGTDRTDSPDVDFDHGSQTVQC